MATALYATILTTPGNVEAIRRYLYGSTEVVEVAPVVQYLGNDRVVGDKVVLILRTEDVGAERCRDLQEQQKDRLASGLHWMSSTYHTRQEAREEAEAQAFDRDQALAGWTPFVLDALVRVSE